MSLSYRHHRSSSASSLSGSLPVHSRGGSASSSTSSAVWSPLLSSSLRSALLLQSRASGSMAERIGRFEVRASANPTPPPFARGESLEQRSLSRGLSASLRRSSLPLQHAPSALLATRTHNFRRASMPSGSSGMEQSLSPFPFPLLSNNSSPLASAAAAMADEAEGRALGGQVEIAQQGEGQTVACGGGSGSEGGVEQPPVLPPFPATAFGVSQAGFPRQPQPPAPAWARFFAPNAPASSQGELETARLRALAQAFYLSAQGPAAAVAEVKPATSVEAHPRRPLRRSSAIFSFRDARAAADLYRAQHAFDHGLGVTDPDQPGAAPQAAAAVEDITVGAELALCPDWNEFEAKKPRRSSKTFTFQRPPPPTRPRHERGRSMPGTRAAGVV